MNASALKAITEHSVITERLLSHSYKNPDKIAVVLESDRQTDSQSLTYRQLVDASLQIASAFTHLGLHKKTIGLLLPAGLKFVTALLGCFFAGAIAVPIAPVGRRNARVRNILNTIRSSEASLVVATQSDLSGGGVAVDLRNLGINVSAVEDLPRAIQLDPSNPMISGESIAVLQYTSGSTGNPSGVIVSHKNLMANQRMIQKCFGHNELTDAVGWAPHYHDQGLFGNILQPLFLGAKCIIISPDDFLRRPLYWLEVITKHGAYTSGGPNFAYDMCVSANRRQPFLGDLSSWKNAFNGAEPIRPASLSAFAKEFSKNGFGPGVELPCYGLAECTLISSGRRAALTKKLTVTCDRSSLYDGRYVPAREGDPSPVELVTCGSAVEGAKIAIVDKSDLKTLLGENVVGEIYISGDHVCNGYWKQIDKSKQTFDQKITGCSDSYLRTGDLGFLHNGELFVVSRIKDTIIVRGRNIYPFDVEEVCRNVSADLSSEAVVAFPIINGAKEGLGVAIEVLRSRRQKADYSALTKALRSSLVECLGVAPEKVFIVRPGSIPRTTSGKVMRARTRKLAEKSALSLAIKK
ncbi:MAG: fatty acyl-AMP ligase [Parvularculaceae bacterium]|nr:MAG: fatty acyl-AMP ligase [Parvularculaceae bacterium]